MTDRNRTYQNERVSTHSDVQCGSANWQTSFLGRGNARIKLPFSGHIALDGYKIVNIYKPPPTRLRTLDLPVFPHPCLYAGDFNCRHADWGYDDNNPGGKCLACLASINCLALLYNAKDAASYYSGLWNTGTNPDLVFASVGPNSRLPDRRVLENFPRSQHRPSLITPPRFAMYGSAKYAC